MKTITLENAEKLIRSTNGSIFTVSFHKVDGSLREMNCRLGVKKNLKGKGLAFDPSEHDLLTVFDMQKDAYRMIRLSAMRFLKVDGESFVIV